MQQLCSLIDFAEVVSSNSAHDEVYSIQHYVIKFLQGLATGWWFSPDTLVSSINKTDRQDIAAILLKVDVKHHSHIFCFIISDIISVDVNQTDSTYEGQNVTMTCIVRYRGNSKMSVLWSKGGDLKVERIGAWFVGFIIMFV